MRNASLTLDQIRKLNCKPKVVGLQNFVENPSRAGYSPPKVTVIGEHDEYTPLNKFLTNNSNRVGV